MSLAERLVKLDATAFAEQRTALLNWICGGVIALGLGLQLWLNRGKGGKPAGADKGKKAEPQQAAGGGPPARRLWWGWPPFRKAG